MKISNYHSWHFLFRFSNNASLKLQVFSLPGSIYDLARVATRSRQGEKFAGTARRPFAVVSDDGDPVFTITRVAVHDNTSIKQVRAEPLAGRDARFMHDGVYPSWY